MQGAYTAAMGITSQQRSLDTIANNLANLNTNGFKASRVDFKDALYQSMQRVVQPQAGIDMQKGHGTLVSGITRIFSPGQYLETGRELDCYLNGEGFFAVQSPAGERLYTRDGSFARDVQADGEYLVTSKGYYVLDQNGQRIRLQGTEVRIGTDGQIYNGGNNVSYARLGMFDFTNREGLQAVSDNLFAVSTASGQAQRAALDTKVEQRVLEGSNVNMAEEFSRMIRSSRAMQISSRALSTADQMDGTANQLR